VTDSDGTTSRRGLLVGLALGLPVIAYGIRGVLVDASDTHPAELARWIVGSAVGHDLVLLPIVAGLAWLLRRLTPSAAWPVVRAGAFAVGVLALTAWPFARGYGRSAGNPSLLPRNYVLGPAAVAAAVAVATLVAAAWCVREAARSTSADGTGKGDATSPEG
jgi:hypothetical protein